MIALGSDHAGFSLKEEIKKHLDETGVEYVDVGCYSPERFDYAISAQKACDKVVSGECTAAILCCGTGVGISMAANKVKGIRACCCSDYFSAKYTRLHMQTLFVWERELSVQVLQSNLLTFSLIQNLRAEGTKIVLTK